MKHLIGVDVNVAKNVVFEPDVVGDEPRMRCANPGDVDGDLALGLRDGGTHLSIRAEIAYAKMNPPVRCSPAGVARFRLGLPVARPCAG